MSSPLIYLILGAAGSGRRELIADLIDSLGPDDRAVVFEPHAPGTMPEAPSAMPHAATHIFFLTDGRRNPIDQLEEFSNWLPTSGARLARIITVIDCKLAAKHHALLGWYEACIHFSDVVLFSHREGVDNKWFSDFLTHFKKQYVPALLEQMKAGKVKNPALILAPEARRVSQVFDEDKDWVPADGEDDDADEVEMTIPEDPYFARSDAGLRLKQIPDINRYLG